LERAEGLRREDAELQEQRAVARARVLPDAGRDRALGEGLTLQQFVELADARIAALREQIADADAEASAKRAALSTAMAERRALERLRERQQDDWRLDADRRARTAMDDVALRGAMEHRKERTQR
jgi:flagellar export protein FliJ